jgi:hypothetical protein
MASVLTIVLILVTVVLTITISIVNNGIKQSWFRRHAKPVLAAMVMANVELFDPESRYKVFPGVVVFGFYEPSPKLCAALRTIADRALALYQARNLIEMSPACRQFAKTIKDHDYTEDRRYLVPQEICGSLEIYTADLHIYKDWLSKTFSRDRMIACAVTGTSKGKIVHLPGSDPVASKLYGAIRG